MYITATHLTTNTSATDATSYNTASITPTARRLVLAAVYSRCTNPPASPSLSGNGLTWVVVATKVSADNLGRLTLYRALITSTTSTGAVAISFGAVEQLRCGWSIAEFAGIDIGGANGANAIVQSATAIADPGNSITTTLAAFASLNNATYGAMAQHSADVTNITEGSGFTMLGEDFNSGEQLAIASEFKATNDTGVDFTTDDSTAGRYSLGIAVEIRIAVGGAFLLNFV